MVLRHKHPLDLERVRESKAKLHVVLTDAQTGKKDVISNHRQFEDIYEELRATSALPILYDRKVAVGGHRYVDGGVADNVPVDVAIDLGCTDIIVVMTKQLSAYHFDKSHTKLMKRLVKKFAKNQSPRVRAKLETDERLLQANLRLLRHPGRKTRVYLLQPSDEKYLVSIGSTNKTKIEELCKLGVTDMDALLHKKIDRSKRLA